MGKLECPDLCIVCGNPKSFDIHLEAQPIHCVTCLCSHEFIGPETEPAACKALGITLEGKS